MCIQTYMYIQLSDFRRHIWAENSVNNACFSWIFPPFSTKFPVLLSLLRRGKHFCLRNLHAYAAVRVLQLVCRHRHAFPNNYSPALSNTNSNLPNYYVTDTAI